ncbi:MAG: CehA/McbA family metallohydrolase [Deltaproteobacteria bacterium]|nr:CehA/McbA family metallohydrolase [Kofleriaceae bacterium]
MRALILVAIAACGSTPPPVSGPAPVPVPDPAVGEPIVADAPIEPALEPAVADAGPTTAIRPPPPRWLKGSTHVHAAPSGDSRTDVKSVIAWYESRGYDFIVLSDHNRVTRVDASAGTDVGPAVRFPDKGLVVLAGIELTYNPGKCEPPPPEPEGKCRIHVNGLGVLARPEGKIEWADRKASTRVAMYRAALRWIVGAGGVVQINHPQWHWGTSSELLALLAGEGVHLVEIANVQFAKWNAGDGKRPSTEQLWDAVLTAGGTMYGIATDDAHDYDEGGGGRYPAGGGWIMVDAPRDPDAIVRAIDLGRFYASTGVMLTRAEVWDGALEIEVAGGAPASHVIRFIGTGGHVLSEVKGTQARLPLAGIGGYVRAVVERKDGARAWVQPVRL